MKTYAYVNSRAGPGRLVSEDSCVVDDVLGLYVVCDGMGAHAAGEVASSLACEVIRRIVAEEDSARDLSRPILESALLEACRIIYDYGVSHPAARGLGTTATAILVRDSSLWIGHVGDSRAYLIRDGQIHQLTRDHTVIGELVEHGVLSPEAASLSPYAHVLTRALGSQPVVVVDTLRVDLVEGDRIILCSDGVQPGLEGLRIALDAETRAINGDQVDLARLLVDEASRGGSDDDMTAVEVLVKACDCKQREAEVVLTYEILSEMALFEELDFSQLALVIEHMRVRSVSADEVVIRRGTAGREIYIILDGLLRAEIEGKGVAEFTKGSHFGELATLSDQSRSTDVRAITDSTLFELSYEAFQALVERDPVIGSKFYRALAEQLCEQLLAMNRLLFDGVESTSGAVGVRKVVPVDFKKNPSAPAMRLVE